MDQKNEVTEFTHLSVMMKHMQAVDASREQLNTLGQHWDLLTILGQMTGNNSNMTATREDFKQLTSELLTNLAAETLKKTELEAKSKAQVAVDIVIRNLFERTADIGFLATDQDIRDFLKLSKHEENTDHTLTSNLVRRFEEYVAKYSVYYNIILLDTEGTVLAQLDNNNPISKSKDPLIEESLTSKAEFCETYRYSDLQADEEKSLIYSYKVTETDKDNAQNLGVLCLCFRFDDEMKGIFNNLVNEDDWSVLTLLDKEGRVISSSDEYHIPLGVTLTLALDEKCHIVRFAGREYLAKTCATNGYQGFEGLGWYGHTMIPLEHAFLNEANSSLGASAGDLLQAIMGDPLLFSDVLRNIPKQASFIQQELDRTVWNGNVQQSRKANKNGANTHKVLLNEISKTGEKTKEVFETSIDTLYKTVVSSILDDVSFAANLCVDIMDRNLYERANDCRWWALTSAFRKLLSERNISADHSDEIANILSYINGLYTVYTNLFVYDKHGTIIAVSNSKEKHLIGQTLQQEWVRQTLKISNTQAYSVSAFEKTPLYDGRSTYIYGAAIPCLNASTKIVGGIGIVFDSEPEFKQMLLESLPRDANGLVKNGTFGLFVNRQKHIISASNASFVVGDTLNIDDDFFALLPGQKISKIIELHGKYYAVGASLSKGYREYKSESDNYKNDVIGLIFVQLGNVSENSSLPAMDRDKIATMIHSPHIDESNSIEVATFYIGKTWLGVRASHVVEATAFTYATGNSSGHELLAGTMRFNSGMIPLLNLSPLLDNEKALRHDPDNNKQVVVVSSERGDVGLLVDVLGDIPEFHHERLVDFNTYFSAKNNFIEAIVTPDQHSHSKSMLAIIDPSKLLRLILNGDQALVSNMLSDLAEDKQDLLKVG